MTVVRQERVKWLKTLEGHCIRFPDLFDIYGINYDQDFEKDFPHTKNNVPRENDWKRSNMTIALLDWRKQIVLEFIRRHINLWMKHTYWGMSGVPISRAVERISVALTIRREFKSRLPEKYSLTGMSLRVKNIQSRRLKSKKYRCSERTEDLVPSYTNCYRQYVQATWKCIIADRSKTFESNESSQLNSWAGYLLTILYFISSFHHKSM